ncbi:MAG: zinc-ribbon domain-containing protein [Thermoanaerobaculaceae bacterium]
MGSTSTPKPKRGVKVLCQWCGAANAEGAEVCLFCGSPLLVLSAGQQAARDKVQEELDYREQLERLAGELQEDVLERLTIQERKLEKIEQALAKLTHRVGELEGSLAIVDAGLRALSQLPDRRKILRETELKNAREREVASEAALHEAVEKLED